MRDEFRDEDPDKIEDWEADLLAISTVAVPPPMDNYYPLDGVNEDHDPDPNPGKREWEARWVRALDVVDGWLAEHDKHLRRSRRLAPDLDDELRRLAAALLVYVWVTNKKIVVRGFRSEDCRKQIFGISFALQQAVGNSEDVDDNAVVRPGSMLHSVMDCACDAEEAGVPEPRAILEAVTAMPNHEATVRWDALRIVAWPPRSARPDPGNPWFTAEEETVPLTQVQQAPVEQLLAGLDAMPGLDSVKSLVRAQTAALHISAERARRGMKVPDQNRHIVFRGNPGTGKTTIARLFASIFANLGICDNYTMVETDRSGLVSQWVGKTALRTNKVIDVALGGVLFIDEAYALAASSDGTGDRFAQEALATLIKRMEDDRDDLIVILAGYPDEMDRLLDMNPGLRSRIGLTVDFDDFTDEGLVEIVARMFASNDYDVTKVSLKIVSGRLAATQRDHTFGNARVMRNVFEATIRAQGVRLYASTAVASDQSLRQITDADLAAGLDEVLPTSRRQSSVMLRSSPAMGRAESSPYL